jgi:hypothetical protein
MAHRGREFSMWRTMSGRGVKTKPSAPSADPLRADQTRPAQVCAGRALQSPTPKHGAALAQDHFTSTVSCRRSAFRARASDGSSASTRLLSISSATRAILSYVAAVCRSVSLVRSPAVNNARLRAQAAFSLYRTASKLTRDWLMRSRITCSLVVSRRRLVPMSGYHRIPLWLRAASTSQRRCCRSAHAALITVAPHWECFCGDLAKD